MAITRDDADPTNANSVTFSVDFSTDVNNVDATDFLLNLTGTATGNATVVVGNAGDADDSTYTVTVNGVAATVPWAWTWRVPPTSKTSWGTA